MNILKKLVDIYGGDVLYSTSAEHWLLPTSTEYQFRYVGAVNESMRVLWEEKHYHYIHSFAAKALVIVPHNKDILYWLIRAMEKQGHTEMARSELLMAKAKLDAEIYDTLVERLHADGEGTDIDS